MWTDYDVIIIGGGPAGLSAGIYTSRAGLHTLLLEKGGIGGELMNRELIENYPGFVEGVKGAELGSAMVQQMTNFGAEFTLGEITAVDVIADCKMVSTAETTYTCKGIVIASGSLPKKLKVPGEQEFTHRGVFYCATKIEKIVGEDQVTAIEMEGCNTGEKSHLEVKGILVRIGLTPNTQFLSCMLPLTPVGQIPVDENMETSIPGIFAAGDVRRHSPMQIATAVGDGVHAAMSLGCYIETL